MYIKFCCQSVFEEAVLLEVYVFQFDDQNLEFWAQHAPWIYPPPRMPVANEGSDIAIPLLKISKCHFWWWRLHPIAWESEPKYHRYPHSAKQFYSRNPPLPSLTPLVSCRRLDLRCHWRIREKSSVLWCFLGVDWGGVWRSISAVSGARLFFSLKKMEICGMGWFLE